MYTAHAPLATSALESVYFAFTAASALASTNISSRQSVLLAVFNAGATSFSSRRAGVVDLAKRPIIPSARKECRSVDVGVNRLRSWRATWDAWLFASCTIFWRRHYSCRGFTMRLFYRSISCALCPLFSQSMIVFSEADLRIRTEGG